MLKYYLLLKKKIHFCDLNYRYLDAKSSQTREQQKSTITEAMHDRNQRLSPTVQPMQKAVVWSSTF